MSKGVAPKPGRKLGHSPQAGRVTAPGDGLMKAWKIPAHPSGKWSPKALDWWAQAISSPSSALWTESDRPQLERTVFMVDEWWRAMAERPDSAMRYADVVRRAEETLYLTPKTRASAGVSVEQRHDGPATAGNARSRLSLLRGAPDAVAAD